MIVLPKGAPVSPLLLVLELELVLSDMMGVVSLNSEDCVGDAESLSRFGTILVDRTENVVAVMRGGGDEVVKEEDDDDDCRGRKASTGETKARVHVPKTHKYIARRQGMLHS
jgi:hypothetical protein